jgi:hypothetical protein
MKGRPHNLRGESFSRIVMVLACFSSLLILFTVPIERVHHFAVHFRTGEARRAAERHTALASDDAPPADPRPHRGTLSAVTITPVLCAATRADAYAATTEVPIARLLSRLKLGSRSDSDSDSLS